MSAPRPHFCKNVQVLHPGVDRIMLIVPGARAAEMVERGQAKLVAQKRKTHGAIRLTESLSVEKCKPAGTHGIRAYMGQKYTYTEPVKDQSGKVFSRLIQLRNDFLDRDDSLAWLFRLSVLQNLSESPDKRWAEQVADAPTQQRRAAASA